MASPHRRLLSGLVATALAGSVVAFAPAPPQATPSHDAPEVEAVRAPDGTWVRTVDGMADRFGFAPGDDLRDPMTWFERSRRVSAASGFDTVSAVDGACVEGCEEEPGDFVDETYAYSTPVADLDGDGTDEVLVMEVTFGEEDVTSTTTAHSGVDGSVLWTSSDSGLAYVGSVPDLDGDGRTDLVGGMWMFGFGMTFSCATPLGVVCTSGEEIDEVLTVEAVRGVDAAPIGSYTVEGSYVFEYEDATVGTPTGRAGREELRVTVDDGFFGLGLVDLDGDGTVQFVHETFDVAFTQRVDGTINDTPLGYADAVVVDSAEEIGGTVELVDIAAGTSETIVSVDDALPIGSTVTGATGDRLLVDLLPDAGTHLEGCVVVDPLVGECSGLPGHAPNTAGPTRTLYGADLTKVWEVPLPETSFFAYGAGADLDGDGVDDLLDLGFDPDTWDDALTAVSGATGETLWTAAASVLQVDGDHLVGARISFMEDLAVDGLVVDPATGTVTTERRLVQQTFEEPEPDQDTVTFGSIGAGTATLTAGSLDVIAQSSLSTYAIEEHCETYEEPDGTTYEECWGELGDLLAADGEMVGADGTDLADLFRLDDPSLVLLDVAEYDGDRGTAELIVQETIDLGWWFPVGGTVRALRLDTSVLWEAATPLSAVGRIDTAEGTADVLVEDGDAGSVSVRDGRDLSERWSVPANVWSGEFVLLVAAVQ